MKYTINDFPDGTIIQCDCYIGKHTNTVFNFSINGNNIRWGNNVNSHGDHMWQLDKIVIISKPILYYELY